MQLCPICNEAISNPICINCLEQELLNWARDQDKKLVTGIRKLRNSLDVFDLGEERCIKCNAEMNICSHCFLTEVPKIIRDENLKNIFRKSFISF